MTMRTYIDPRALPLRRAFTTARGSWQEREVCVVSVEVGHVRGFGEASPLPGFSTETFEESMADVRAMCSKLHGEALPKSVQAIDALMRHIGQSRAPSARFAIEGALLDVLARVQQKSVAKLLSDSATMYVPVNATIGALPAPERFVRAMSLKDSGHTCFKLKVGASALDEEMASVRAVREAAGDAATIRLDVNGAWDATRAIEAIESLSRYDIELVEQPVPSHDIEALARVRAAVCARGVLVAADEALATPEPHAVLDELIAREAADVIVLKPMMLGGLLPTLELMRRAHAHGIPSIVTTLLEGVIGRTLTAHLAAAATPYLHGPCGLDTGKLLASDLADEPYTISSGVLALPPDHGLGLDLVMSQRAHGVTPEQPPAHTAPETLPVLLRRARSHVDVPALLAAEGQARSYAELAAHAARLVTWLRAQGVLRGDTVALCAQNSPELVAMIHASMAMGACIVPLHPKLTDAEIARALQRVSPALALGDVPRVPGMRTLEEAIAGSTHLEAAPHALMQGYAMEDRAVILFTSGTTGEPKMVSLSWSNLFYSATGSAIRLGHLPGDRWGLSLPLCHIGGLSIVVRCALLGTTVVMHEQGFEPERVAGQIERGELTMWSAVSAMMWQVLDVMQGPAHERFRFALLGGGPVPRALLDACEARRVPVAVTYGMTETGSQLTTRASGMVGVDAASAGPALLFSEVRVAGGAEEGTLQVRGQTLCQGYLDESLQVVDLRDEQGWFDTGDWGRVGEAGEVQMLDRRTDLIVTGGENVYPARIEQVLLEHDGVREACVVGLPDERWGQRVVAVIVPEENTSLDVASVLEVCRARMASFAVPRQVACWESIPRTSLGKPRRAEVRRLLLQGSAAPRDHAANSRIREVNK